MLDTQNWFQNHIKNAKGTKFLLQSAFYTSKESFTFLRLGLSFMVSSVAPTRSSTSYAYFITKIGNGNLNLIQEYPAEKVFGLVF